MWGFPILVAIHIIGLVFSVGIVVWLDLRLLGVSMTGVPVSRVYRRLMPLAFVGLAVMMASGATIFTGFATSAYKNPYFRVKLIALLLAGLNALVYHTNIERRIALWDRLPSPPGRSDGRHHLDRGVGDGDSCRAHDVVHAVYALGRFEGRGSRLEVGASNLYRGAVTNGVAR